MGYQCPYCGNSIKYGLYCNVCLKRIDWIEDIGNRSMFYYNKGLEAARSRKLSIATIYLQKAIMLYKYNIEARNLLGLIYFEVGQIGEALKEWIISCSLKKEDNKAIYYMEKVQKQAKTIENRKEAIILYNRGLGYLRQKNMDMAIIRLKKAVSINPHFVEARTLLALAYIEQKQYYKANEQVKKALDVDKSHKMALLYFKYLSAEDTNDVQPYELEYKNQRETSFKKIVDRGANLRRNVVYFLLGSVSVAVIGVALVMPSQMSAYESEIKQLKLSEETLSEKLQTVSEGYQVELTELKNSKGQLEEEVKRYKASVERLTQKEKLNLASKLREQGDHIKAAETLYSIASSSLEEEDVLILNELKERIYPRAIDSLYNEGVDLHNRAQYMDAIMSFETVLLYEPEEWIGSKTLYYLAESYKESGEIDLAKKYYEKVKIEYPETSAAYQANSRLERLNEE
ncbi:MAG: tetratricopeptide repeat protein [Cellulosilyticum sp.]|nr:tetratricopeptide repeat protein [Cellulosilyticum sp.]